MESVDVDTVVCPPLICVPNPKIPKILTILQGAVETARLTWRNPFGHQST